MPLVQHVLALLRAAALYVLLMRLGVRAWLAALATAARCSTRSSC